MSGEQQASLGHVCLNAFNLSVVWLVLVRGDCPEWLDGVMQEVCLRSCELTHHDLLAELAAMRKYCWVGPYDEGMLARDMARFNLPLLIQAILRAVPGVETIECTWFQIRQRLPHAVPGSAVGKYSHCNPWNYDCAAHAAWHQSRARLKNYKLVDDSSKLEADSPVADLGRSLHTLILTVMTQPLSCS